MWTWDHEHEAGSLSVPFASAREATWAHRTLGSGWYAESIQVRIGATTGRFLGISAEVAKPDSAYDDEWDEIDDRYEHYRARTQAALAGSVAKVDAELAALGLTPAPRAEFAADAEQRIADVLPRIGRAMPPTRRHTRDAVYVSEVIPAGYRAEHRTIDASTVFCNYQTGEAIPPVPLVVGEMYWMTGNCPIVATVDVADVPPGAESVLADILPGDARPTIDLRAFLARELQYGPLDVDRARGILLRRWLAEHNAVSTEAGPIALANSQRMLERRLGPGTWAPWPEDGRILLRTPAPSRK